jgi:hypothetical protein
MNIGDEIVRDERPEIIERIEAHDELGWHLKALYFGKKISTEIVVEELGVWRYATLADRVVAIAYAERFKEPKDEPT